MTTNVPSKAELPLDQHLSDDLQISRFTPAQIREAVSHWVAQDRLDLADALVTAGVGLYPESEDILAIGALMAEVRQDWPQAQTLLERLLTVQGSAATAESHYHLVRVMRCRAAYFPALRAAELALQIYPTHAGLQQEQVELAELLDTAALEVETLASAN